MGDESAVIPKTMNACMLTAVNAFEMRELPVPDYRECYRPEDSWQYGNPAEDAGLL